MKSNHYLRTLTALIGLLMMGVTGAAAASKTNLAVSLTKNSKAEEIYFSEANLLSNIVVNNLTVKIPVEDYSLGVNAIKTNLYQFPNGDQYFLTNGTGQYLLTAIKNTPILFESIDGKQSYDASEFYYSSTDFTIDGKDYSAVIKTGLAMSTDSSDPMVFKRFGVRGSLKFTQDIIRKGITGDVIVNSNGIVNLVVYASAVLCPAGLELINPWKPINDEQRRKPWWDHKKGAYLNQFIYRVDSDDYKISNYSLFDSTDIVRHYKYGEDWPTINIKDDLEHPVMRRATKEQSRLFDEHRKKFTPTASPLYKWKLLQNDVFLKNINSIIRDSIGYSKIDTSLNYKAEVMQAKLPYKFELSESYNKEEMVPPCGWKMQSDVFKLFPNGNNYSFIVDRVGRNEQGFSLYSQEYPRGKYEKDNVISMDVSGNVQFNDESLMYRLKKNPVMTLSLKGEWRESSYGLAFFDKAVVGLTLNDITATVIMAVKRGFGTIYFVGSAIENADESIDVVIHALSPPFKLLKKGPNYVTAESPDLLFSPAK